MGNLTWKRIKQECLAGWTFLLGLFYPETCGVCGESLVKDEKYLCTSCLADFPLADRDFPLGRKVLEHFEESCRPRELFVLFYYNKFSPYKNLIYLVKYRSQRELGVYLGRMLGKQMLGKCEADCIIPVPLHKKREKQRGFNQAREIARGISEVTGIPLRDDVLFRVKNNVSQTGKNAAERLKNVENIFELRNPAAIRGKHILLVDDVITTGATLGACLQKLALVPGVRFSLGCLAQTM